MVTDEKRILKQAQPLLQEKKYQEARELLLTIPNNTTAQKWLSQLDQLAPVAPVQKRRDQAVEPQSADWRETAKMLIEAKRYREAHQLLGKVNHPTAQKWLQKVEELINKHEEEDQSTGIVAADSLELPFHVAGDMQTVHITSAQNRESPFSTGNLESFTIVSADSVGEMASLSIPPEYWRWLGYAAAGLLIIIIISTILSNLNSNRLPPEGEESLREFVLEETGSPTYSIVSFKKGGVFPLVGELYCLQLDRNISFTRGFYGDETPYIAMAFSNSEWHVQTVAIEDQIRLWEQYGCG